MSIHQPGQRTLADQTNHSSQQTWIKPIKTSLSQWNTTLRPTISHLLLPPKSPNGSSALQILISNLTAIILKSRRLKGSPLHLFPTTLSFVLRPILPLNQRELQLRAGMNGMNPLITWELTRLLLRVTGLALNMLRLFENGTYYSLLKVCGFQVFCYGEWVRSGTY
jgi:hypothetical protein